MVRLLFRLVAALLSVAVLPVASALAQDPHSIVVSADGQARIPQTTEQTDQAIARAVRAARSRALAQALRAADADARRQAITAGASLGSRGAIQTAPAAPGTFGTLAPGRYCTPLARGTRSLARHTRAQRRCRIPQEVTVSVEVTYALASSLPGGDDDVVVAS